MPRARLRIALLQSLCVSQRPGSPKEKIALLADLPIAHATFNSLIPMSR
jgi:hypothetical protein